MILFKYITLKLTITIISIPIKNINNKNLLAVSFKQLHSYIKLQFI